MCAELTDLMPSCLLKMAPYSTALCCSSMSRLSPYLLTSVLMRGRVVENLGVGRRRRGGRERKGERMKRRRVRRGRRKEEGEREEGGREKGGRRGEEGRREKRTRKGRGRKGGRACTPT